MRDLWLAARLVRRAGGRDIWVIAAMAMGIAIAVFGLLLSTAMPVIVANQQHRVGARLSSGSSTPLGIGQGARVTSSREGFDNRVYTREVVEGATPGSVLPPGLSRWPAAGHSMVSPALARLIEHDPALATRMSLGVVDADRIGPAQLVDPQELRSYTTLDARPIADGDTFGVGGVTFTATPANVMLAEFALLAGFPVGVFLAHCLRATARARARRYRGLTVLGVSARRCARMYATEMTIIAGVGLVSGVVAYVYGQGPLGESGVFGVSWWADDARLRSGMVLPLAVLSVVGPFAVHACARRAMVWQLARGHHTGRTQQVRPAVKRFGIVVVGALLLISVGYLGWVVVQAEPGVMRRTDSPVYTHTLQAALVAMATVPFLSAPLVRTVAMLTARLSLAARMAGRALDHRWIVARRLVTATTAAVVVVAMANTFVLWVALVQTSGDPVDTVMVDLPTDAPGPSLRSIIELGGRLEFAVLPQSTVPGIERVTFIRCPADDVLPCPARGRRSPTLPQDARVTIPLTDGRHVTVPIGALPTDPSMSPGTAVLDLDRSPWAGQISDELLRGAAVSIDMPSAGSATRAAVEAVHRVAPRATVQTGESEETGQLAREQAILLRSCLVTGLVATLGAFVLVLAGIAAEGRRSINALVAVGAPQRFLRATHALQAGLPIAVAGLVTAPVCTLTSWALVSMFGAEHMSLWQPLWAFVPALGIPAVIAGWAWAAGGYRFDRRLLRD